MTKFEAEKMHEVDEMKNRFFANISHEFRTPLTLIFGPAKDVLEKTDDPHTKKNVGIIKRNTSRLYSLVNQLLDLSKLEAGKLKLEASEQDIIQLLKGIFLSFTSFAERKKIMMQFNSIDESLFVYIDRDKVEKIINNLLSNAFKFTPEGGKIDFTVERMIDKVEIRITDNGIGIPEERIDKIFDRFYQVDGSHPRQGEGTGIGLALTKELVELHRGKIMVKSKEGEGTTFTVQLPLGKDHLKPEEIVEKEFEEVVPETEEQPEPAIETENKKEKTDIDVLLDTEKPLLLIVEDNSDVRSYIISHLEVDYRIQEAVDGEDGLEQAMNHIPDLIISDVMMPKMDGFELCEKLKTDERTNHIPIIMLTAKATSKDKIEGYETGADDYIMKPFDTKELKVRIKNLTEQRRKLREHFRKESLFVLDDKNITKTDKEFLKKAIEIIHGHLSDTSFGVDSFAEEIAISRSQLHRKLIALVGEPPGDIIRQVRLTASAKLIKEDFGNISEIAAEVGFSNPANFAQCFRKQFGVSPSDYKNQPII
jgi:DNA-binding response OmpR family regulator/two-component sensor histidine kinase